MSKVWLNKTLTRSIAEYLPLTDINKLATTCHSLEYIISDDILQ
ncbi:MAG: hypothetical protein Faunusvirus30_9, partial [Faunusvirus sp.]